MASNLKIFTKTDAPLSEMTSVIALGNFDGVHLAHRALLLEAVRLAKRLGDLQVGAFCFSGAPAAYLSGASVPLLCPLEKRIEKILALGVDFVAVADFKDFCDVSAEDFIQNTLKGELRAVGAVCGFNNRFGKGGVGTPLLLREQFGEDAVVVLPEVKLNSDTVSSSAIRALLADGKTETAAEMLGEPFSLTSRVVHGKRLGRALGFPTANLLFPRGTVIPGRGIYATRVITPDGVRRIGVSNVGIRPTITDGSDTHAANCETYIHDFCGDLYDKTLTVEFCRYLRAERKFDSVDALKEQISRDLTAAIDYFSTIE